MEFRVISTENLRDISELVLDDLKRPKVLPASFYRRITVDERAAFCVRNAIYGLPTSELVQWLRETIGDRSAIEIGAGNGALAEALGITATDSRMQEDPAVQAHYRLMRQASINYGANVERLDAADAVRKYRPNVVVASWVTHMFNPDREEAGGNQMGVVEEDIIANCKTYIFIGNAHVHRHKSIWALPHSKLTPDWLYSRAFNGSPDFIAVWGEFTPLA
ncbi:hypothetical protein [Burkholderia cenocepacia]|uniref:hypothetical protein n=1 Tax=Burkholderia cenocepacia TaxID=95486 RepID=UPI0007615877|nr:hypothetical protein [Burkholderia cenocepacia]KWU17940.1 hypothetical protein AS149_14800 [Burkholderia cenocepacia]